MFSPVSFCFFCTNFSIINQSTVTDCLIENLAAPEKQDFKISDISYSPWLQSLASFAAAIFKRYALDFGGILQYIANQLKAAQTWAKQT
jgi:hypothetical protein